MNPTDGLTSFFYSEARRCNGVFYAPLLGNDGMLVFVDPHVCIEVSRRAEELIRGAGFAYDKKVLGLKHELLFSNWGSSWQEQRRRANPFFKPSAMRNLFDTIVECSRQVEDTDLLEHANSGKVRDLKLDTAAITLRVICTHIFGHQLPKSLENVLFELFLSLLPPEFQLRVSGFGWLPLPKRWRFFQCRKKALSGVASEILRAEKGSFCELRPEEDMDQKLSDVMGLVFAGFETTSNAVAWAMFFLSEQPETVQAILSQLSSALGDRSIDELTAADLKACPLLLAAFYESLRLRAPAPGHPVDTTNDVTLQDGKYFIPKGTTVYAMYSFSFLDEKFFENPNTFDLFRWIDGRAEKAASKIGMSISELFTPFLVGQHVCLGRQLAELEGQIILARWLHRFSFDFAGTSKPKFVLSVAMTMDSLPMRISESKKR